LLEHNGIDAKQLNVMSYLSENYYACPTSLCGIRVGGYGYYNTQYAFKMEYDKNCIISQDYVSKYKCGSLDNYMQEFDKLVKSNDGSNKVNLKYITDKITVYCDSIFKNLNYDDPTDCVKECLQIENIV